jgi:hypothetical protein
MSDWVNLIFTIKYMKSFEYDFTVVLNVGESEQRWLDVEDLSRRLINNTGMDLSEVDFGDKDRRIVHRGIIERQGQDWTVVYAVLLDNCLILTTPVAPAPVNRLTASDWVPYDMGLELNNLVSYKHLQMSVTGTC